MTGIISDPPSIGRKHDPRSGLSKKKKEKRHKAVAQSAAHPSEGHLSLQNQRLKSPNDKGKSRASDSNEFHMVNAGLVLSIPPVFASDLRAGVEEMLDSMVMRYIPSLHGVLLAHSNVQFLSQTARINGDCPFAVCSVSFDATIWGPRVSMKLVGRINLCSPDHISLLVHRTFNVSIPRHHIPQDQWTFEYGPAENDPEFGDGRNWGDEPKSATDGEGDIEMSDSIEPKATAETRETGSSGRWVHHLTGSRLGDPDGYIEFTVIGLTVANEMLSLQGSIQPDPFSPEHVPHPVKRASVSPLRQDETSESEAYKSGNNEVVQENEDEDSDEDGFRYLVRLTDEARARQKARRAEKEADRLEKAKKRKRRESRTSGVGEDSRHGKTGKKRIKKTTS